MTEYSFSTRWDIAAPVDQVWEVLADTSGYPQWWRYVEHVQHLADGDGTGVGAVQRIRWRTALPYTLTFQTRITRIERPHLIEIAAGGELEGTGLWTLAEQDGITTVRYDWNVSTTKAWMNLLAPLARPAFAWNHRILMREGGESLARLLNAALLHSEESMKHARTDAVLPAALLLLLAAYLTGRLRGRRGRRPHAIASGREPNHKTGSICP